MTRPDLLQFFSPLAQAKSLPQLARDVLDGIGGVDARAGGRTREFLLHQESPSAPVPLRGAGTKGGGEKMQGRPMSPPGIWFSFSEPRWKRSSLGKQTVVTWKFTTSWVLGPEFMVYDRRVEIGAVPSCAIPSTLAAIDGRADGP